MENNMVANESLQTDGQTKNKNYKKYITILHVFCAFAVVILHSNNGFWSFSKTNTWLVANAIESILYFAVPVFMMVSSATLLDYRERYSTKEFAKRRVEKAVIPYVFWTIVALVVFGLTKKINFQPNPIVRVLNGFLKADVYEMNIYNFFLELFVCYLCVPIFSLIPKEQRQKPFLFIILYGIIVNSLLPLTLSLLGIPLSIPKLPILGSYMIFMFIGYYISSYPIKKWCRLVIYGLGLIALAVHLFGTWHYSYQMGRVYGVFKGYVNATSIIYSSAVFLFFKNLEDSKLCDFLYKICKPFAPTTLGIYLIHRYFIILAWDYIKIPRTNLVFATVGGVAIFFLSFIVVKLLQKIPLIKKTLP